MAAEPAHEADERPFPLTTGAPFLPGHRIELETRVAQLEQLLAEGRQALRTWADQTGYLRARVELISQEVSVERADVRRELDRVHEDVSETRGHASLLENHTRALKETSELVGELSQAVGRAERAARELQRRIEWVGERASAAQEEMEKQRATNKRLLLAALGSGTLTLLVLVALVISRIG